MNGIAVAEREIDERPIVSVCCHCRRLRTPTGEWRDEVPPCPSRLSHGICPACLVRFYPELHLPAE